MNSEVKCNDIELGTIEWTNSPSRRRVHFLSTVQIRETLPIGDYSPEEIQHSWYSKREFKQAREVLRTWAKSDKESTASNESLICVRGLEAFEGIGLLKRRKNKLNGLLSVLKEQERQRGLGVWNPSEIAISYSIIAGACLKEAYLLGLSDEFEVRNS
jgi:hypothetical protein